MALKQKNREIVFLPKSYTPSEVEPYMNEMHLEYFRNELLTKRNHLQDEWEVLNGEIHSSADIDTDMGDRASRDVVMFSNIKRLETIQHSITSIDVSLNDIEYGKYGFCKKTGGEIGIKRLLANPEAKFCVEAQEGVEHEE
ncbi:MAG: TraR/DksA C4-type zinc finger protein [Proteobacteria bacterium]|jgi:DnaK suppressor protein|nr:TraR/DksA C4-type zinc finger protein [Pseudomonadota bacterium]